MLHAETVEANEARNQIVEESASDEQVQQSEPSPLLKFEDTD